MRREGVPLETEGADPELAADVDLAVGVEDGAAGRLAGDGLVEDRGEVVALLEGRVEGGDGDDDAGALEARAGPDVPAGGGRRQQAAE